jgi:IclR family transcriptional regulator, pca regulon regulatory protein
VTDEGDRRPSLQSLERGIAVIQVFSRERPALTLSEVARLTGITRATARRILLTSRRSAMCAPTADCSR